MLEIRQSETLRLLEAALLMIYEAKLLSWKGLHKSKLGNAAGERFACRLQHLESNCKDISSFTKLSTGW